PPLAERPDARHVRAHDPVALLRDPLDLIEPADRLDAETEERDAEVAAEAHDLAYVGRELLLRTVDRRTLLAGELELTARLERDRCATACQRHRPAVLFLRLPAVALREPAEKRLDAARARKRRRPARLPVDP